MLSKDLNIMKIIKPIALIMALYTFAEGGSASSKPPVSTAAQKAEITAADEQAREANLQAEDWEQQAKNAKSEADSLTLEAQNAIGTEDKKLQQQKALDAQRRASDLATYAQVARRRADSLNNAGKALKDKAAQEGGAAREAMIKRASQMQTPH
jgi:hypothetical protein